MCLTGEYRIKVGCCYYIDVVEGDGCGWFLVCFEFLFVYIDLDGRFFFF